MNISRMPALVTAAVSLAAWSLFGVIWPDIHVNLKNTSVEKVPVEIGWLPPDIPASFNKPNFSDYGKERIHEYLDACASSQVIPEIVWSFWFGDKPMNDNRKRAADTMERILEVPVILVTTENLESFTKWPVNPFVKYLSGNHQSDYFRIYFLLHYGGGYSDIKHHLESWANKFEEFRDRNVWIVGVPEVYWGVAARPGDEFPADYYQLMVSNGFLIGRPESPFLKEVHEIQNGDLDRKSRDLMAHPPPNRGRCCLDDPQGYPFRWTEVMGEVAAHVAQKYYMHFRRSLTMPSLSDYI